MTERSVEVPRATERSAFDRFAALLQNSERRYDEAFHHKIDAVVAGLADLMESQAEPDRKLLKRHIEELRAAVGLEREL
jgi:hypothetical protein